MWIWKHVALSNVAFQEKNEDKKSIRLDETYKKWIVHGNKGVTTMDTCNDNGNIWVSKIITRSESRAMYGFLSDKEEIKKNKKEITTTTGYHIIPESSHLNKKKKRKKRSIIIIIKKGIEQSNFSYREAKIK